MSNKFKVNDPAATTLGVVETAVLVFVPFLLRDGLPAVVCYALSAVFALLGVYFVLLKAASLTVDEEGVHCKRPLRKDITIKWAELGSCGTYSRVTYIKGKQFVYFSKKTLSGSIAEAQQKQTLTDDFVFALKVPDLEAAVRKYSGRKL